MPDTTIKHIIAISSCKGGVGKSTIAAHLACALAQQGKGVGLLDCDIHGPSIPSLFNLQNTRINVDEFKQFIPVEKHNLKIMSFGFLLGDAPAVMRGPIITRYVQQLLINTAWGKLDYLFIDMPPGTGDVQLTITQTVRLTGAVIVTTPQTLSLIDVARGILMFEKVSVPILGIIENMSYFLCDECDKKHHIFGKSEGKLKERFGIETLAELPLLPQMILPIDQPLENTYIHSAAQKIVQSIDKQSTEKNALPKIEFNEKEIIFNWNDGIIQKINNRELRLNCRCALCVNEITGASLLDEKRIRSDIAPKEITPLGNYAVGISWNDGHSSGIYPYELIKKMEKDRRVITSETK